MAARTLTATLPSGEIVTRKTARAYAYVVALKAPTSGEWFANNWASSYALAEAVCAFPGYERQIVPVNA
jgi:hypothetical protein